MSNAESIQRHLGSLFVATTFLNTFSGGLASNIAMTICMANEVNGAPLYSHSADAAVPLASVLRAAQQMCLGTHVDDEDSLADMLETVRKQFEVVDDCNETDKTLALGNLEHVFALASRKVRISAIVDARFRLIVDGKSAPSVTRRGGAQVRGLNVSHRPRSA